MRVARDITADKAAAERLKATEEALLQFQKMEAVGQLTGGIAHDFNNLLTGIVGSLDLLQTRLSQGRADNVARYIDAAMTSANRAAALTHRLLAFARRQPLVPKIVDADQLVGSLEDLVRRTIGETIDLAIIASKDLWCTLCDPNQLESALLNLAINARDAMPDGGKLTIATANAQIDGMDAGTPALAPGDYVCIAVTDTGTGMSAEVAARHPGKRLGYGVVRGASGRAAHHVFHMAPGPIGVLSGVALLVGPLIARLQGGPTDPPAPLHAVWSGPAHRATDDRLWAVPVTLAVGDDARFRDPGRAPRQGRPRRLFPRRGVALLPPRSGPWGGGEVVQVMPLGALAAGRRPVGLGVIYELDGHAVGRLHLLIEVRLRRSVYPVL